MIWARLVLVVLALGWGAAQAQTEPEPAGYRQDDYRAPVPALLTGAEVIGGEAAHALWRTGRVAFVDVLPHAPKPDNLPAGTIWREKPRNSIPGAIWLPNVGYGRIADVTDRYFRAGLAKATHGDATAPVVFFCLDECWMSWNAAKRALTEYGYTNVFWYPGGTDDWEFQSYPTEVVTPAVLD